MRGMTKLTQFISEMTNVKAQSRLCMKASTKYFAFIYDWNACEYNSLDSLSLIHCRSYTNSVST